MKHSVVPSVRWVNSPDYSDGRYEFSIPPFSHNVYYLMSTVGSRTYVGYSVNPFHRLREHNGELVGGAKATRLGRPYRIVCIISGFPTERAALQFEKAWHILRRTTKYRTRITGCHEALQILFSRQWTARSPPPFSFPLTLLWINPPPSLHSVQEPRWTCQPQPDTHNAWVIYTGYYHYVNPGPIIEIEPSSPKLEVEIIEDDSFEITINP